MIKAIVTSTFVHGANTYRPGDQAEFSPPVFASLAGYGLVGEAPAPSAEQTAPAQRMQRAARTPSNKKAPEPDNKDATAAATAPPPADTSTPQAVEASTAPTATAAATAPPPADTSTPQAVEASTAPTANAADPAPTAGANDAAADA